MEIKDVEKLIHAMDQTSIQSIEIQKKDFKVIIDKNHNDPTNENVSKDIAKKDIPKNLEPESLYVVQSPIVGVFYESNAPGHPPFIKIGDHVTKGQTLCILEAMKIMNTIESDYEGEVVEILVENEDVVEYGQPLMTIRRMDQ